jgi:carbonyl reductase 1
VGIFLTARTKTKGKEACDSLQKEGIRVRFHPLDVDDSGSIRSVRETVEKGPGRVDILVNNVGANLNGEKTGKMWTPRRSTGRSRRTYTVR